LGKCDGTLKKSIFNEQDSISLENLISWLVIALIAGFTGACLVRFFDVLIELMHRGISHTPIPLVFWPVIGALGVGGIIYRIREEASGEGIPGYIQGIVYHQGDLNFSTTVMKFLAALLTLGTLGNGGIIGPLGRVSAGIGSSVEKKLHTYFNICDIRTGAISGMAAVVGAVFHTSIGGGIFAVEIIRKAELRYRDIFPAVLSSTTAVYVCKAFGWESFYQINAVNQFMDVEMIWGVLLVAALAGLAGRFYTSFYRKISSFFGRERNNLLLAKVLVGSAVASVLAWVVNPELMGTSRNLIARVFHQQDLTVFGQTLETVPLGLVFLLFIAVKAAANDITVGSGMSAGFTGPAAIIGILLGAVGACVFQLSPGTANYYAFMAAGFSGMLASSMNIPLAAAIITLESFGLQYSFPAGIAAIVGFQMTRHATIYSYAYKNIDDR